ncbi:hypothetical protein LCGC14_1591010 [marine sediment metagenome]|uniref:Uncharacterized protein n=1 Tax=marine sediment metagenome TaxID=412755 RepID=A0A0F9IDW7_9ZZZZ
MYHVPSRAKAGLGLFDCRADYELFEAAVAGAHDLGAVVWPAGQPRDAE